MNEVAAPPGEAVIWVEAPPGEALREEAAQTGIGSKAKTLREEEAPLGDMGEEEAV